MLRHQGIWFKTCFDSSSYILSKPVKHAGQGSHGYRKTWKMKMVMEKSWNMKNWPKNMEFCVQSWKLRKFKIKERNGHGKIFCQVCGNPGWLTTHIFSVTTKKLSSDLPSCLFVGFCFLPQLDQNGLVEYWPLMNNANLDPLGS